MHNCLNSHNFHIPFECAFFHIVIACKKLWREFFYIVVQARWHFNQCTFGYLYDDAACRCFADKRWQLYLISFLKTLIIHACYHINGERDDFIVSSMYWHSRKCLSSGKKKSFFFANFSKHERIIKYSHLSQNTRE